jgi:hypothetical protein
MEILTTVTVEGKTLLIDQTFNLPQEGKFITIKELFSIEGEIFVAIINHQIPHTINTPSGGIQTGRFIMPARQFVLQYPHLFN